MTALPIPPIPADPTQTTVIPTTVKRPRLLGSPFAPVFGVNGQSADVGRRDLMLAFPITRSPDLLLLNFPITKLLNYQIFFPPLGDFLPWLIAEC
jgi:hypothetical protein